MIQISAFFRDFECEAGLSSEGVTGRLFSARSFWFSHLFAQNIVTYGYTMLLKAFPASAFFNNDVPPLSIQILLHKLSRNCYVSIVLMSMTMPPMLLTL